MFYSIRLFLGLLSVLADAVLVVALSRKYGNRIASYTLAMLCLTSGCFFASTSELDFHHFPVVFLATVLVPPAVILCGLFVMFSYQLMG